MPQGNTGNYSSAVKNLPTRLESTAPANPISGIAKGSGAQTATAGTGRQYQTAQQNQMMFTDRGGVYRRATT